LVKFWRFGYRLYYLAPQEVWQGLRDLHPLRFLERIQQSQHPFSHAGLGRKPLQHPSTPIFLCLTVVDEFIALDGEIGG
jgi:hypothetical protein